MKFFYPQQEPEIQWHIPGSCQSCPKTDHKKKFSTATLTIVNHQTGESLTCNTYADGLKGFFPKANNSLIELKEEPQRFGKVFSVKIDPKVDPVPFEYTPPAPSATPQKTPSAPKNKYTAQQMADFVADAFNLFFMKFGDTTNQNYDASAVIAAAQHAASGLLIQCQFQNADLVLDHLEPNK